MIFTSMLGSVVVIEGLFSKDGDVIKNNIEELGSMKNRCLRVSGDSRVLEMAEMIQTMINNRKI